MVQSSAALKSQSILQNEAFAHNLVRTRPQKGRESGPGQAGSGKARYAGHPPPRARDIREVNSIRAPYYSIADSRARPRRNSHS